MHQSPFYILDRFSYDTHHIIGKGSFAHVYKGLDTVTQKIVAIKIITLIDVNDKLKQSVYNEIEIMKSLNHENIVKLIDYEEKENQLFLIQEFCDKGNLKILLAQQKQLIERKALEIFIQVINGCYELFKVGIIHRDLKPENILFKEDIVKLADFGLSKQLNPYQDQLLQSIVGTPNYMSLQLLRNQPYSTKSDIWSLGVIYYEMLFGRTPWKAQSQYELVELILNQIIRFPVDFHVSDQSKDFILRCLQKEETNRLSWQDVFMHSLFQKRYHYSVIKNENETHAQIIKDYFWNQLCDSSHNYTLFFQAFHLKYSNINKEEFIQIAEKVLQGKFNQESFNFLFSFFDVQQRGILDEKNFREFYKQKYQNLNEKSEFNGQQELEDKIKTHYKEIQPFLKRKTLLLSDFINIIKIIDSNIPNQELVDFFNIHKENEEIIVSQFLEYLQIPPLFSPNKKQSRFSFDIDDNLSKVKQILKDKVNKKDLKSLFKLFSNTSDSEMLTKKEFTNLVLSFDSQLDRNEIKQEFQEITKGHNSIITRNEFKLLIN